MMIIKGKQLLTGTLSSWGVDMLLKGTLTGL